MNIDSRFATLMSNVLTELKSLRRRQRLEVREEVTALLVSAVDEHTTQSWCAYIWTPPLYILNWRAGVWHLVLALLMLYLKLEINPPFVLEFNRSWATVNTTDLPAAVLNNTCCASSAGNCKVYNDVYEWFACIRPKVEEWRGERIENENDIPLYQPKLTEMFAPISLIWLIIAFEIITSGFHLWVYRSDGGKWCSKTRGNLREYTKNLSNQLNPLRWLEYSITASLMLLASLALSRVSDTFLLTSLFINSFFLNFVGGNCFELLYLGQRQLKGTEFEAVFRNVKWAAFGASWFCFIVNIWTYWDAYLTIVEPYLDLPLTGELWEQLFGFVTIANTTITIDFCIFPIIHLYQFGYPWSTKKRELEAYKQGECAFIWASFVSKTILTSIIGSAALMRKDQS